MRSSLDKINALLQTKAGRLILAGLLMAGEGSVLSAEATATNSARMQLLAKEVFIRHRGGRPAATGFVTYISDTQPILMHCSGWQDYSDGYDDYSISISKDNGKSWSEPQVKWKSKVLPEGKLRFAEPAAYFDSALQKLIVLIDQTLYPKDKLNVDAEYSLIQEVYDPATDQWATSRSYDSLVSVRPR
jgi:hypothetical protein